MIVWLMCSQLAWSSPVIPFHFIYNDEITNASVDGINKLSETESIPRFVTLLEFIFSSILVNIHTIDEQSSYQTGIF